MSVRESRDQHSFDNSPELFAVFHALQSLLTPRHPPCALSSLVHINPTLSRTALIPKDRRGTSETLVRIWLPTTDPGRTSLDGRPDLKSNARFFCVPKFEGRLRFRGLGFASDHAKSLGEQI
jgi:hypothetical protein